MAKLKRAREYLDAKDLPPAMAIYEDVLLTAGDRADVLVVVSGDLGSTGHVAQVIELVAPRYDARRHGPATGFNLLQAYLAARDAAAAQHVLDLLFDLKRPDLEERLFGFSNAISELLLADDEPGGQFMTPAAGEAPPPSAAKVGVVTISKPIWFYGLEPLAERILPRKPEGKTRRVAFAQLALPGLESDEALRRPDSGIAQLSSALPAWLAEIFAYARAYSSYIAVAFVEKPDGSRHPMVFGSEWTTANLRHVVENTDGGLDYVLTGALRHHAGDFELILRVWEVKKYRERKQFVTRWTPATMEAELGKLREQVCQFMEWSPGGEAEGVPYARPGSARDWLEILGASLNLFLAEKKLLPREGLAPLEPVRDALARAAPQSVAASLAALTLEARVRALGLPPPAPAPVLMPDPLVAEAAALLRAHAPGDR